MYFVQPFGGIYQIAESSVSVHVLFSEIPFLQVGTTGDNLHDDYTIVLKFSHPQEQTHCRGHFSDAVTLRKGAIYVIDTRYWNSFGVKCFKARPHLPSCKMAVPHKYYLRYNFQQLLCLFRFCTSIVMQLIGWC